MGPMQFLPGTWSRYASDGDGDGRADPQNLYDATLAAARYLCSGGLDLRDPSQVLAAILRYNNSMPYARNVVGWAAAYATGVVPIDLPPLTGPAPPIADTHLERAEGLGPGLPLNATGLPPTDPLAQLPLVDFGPTQTAGQPGSWPGQPPAQQAPSCAVFCLAQPSQAPAAQPAAVLTMGAALAEPACAGRCATARIPGARASCTTWRARATACRCARRTAAPATGGRTRRRATGCPAGRTRWPAGCRARRSATRPPGWRTGSRSARLTGPHRRSTGPFGPTPPRA